MTRPDENYYALLSATYEDIQKLCKGYLRLIAKAPFSADDLDHPERKITTGEGKGLLLPKQNFAKRPI
jgi:hypothetical protein